MTPDPGLAYFSGVACGGPSDSCHSGYPHWAQSSSVWSCLSAFTPLLLQSVHSASAEAPSLLPTATAGLSTWNASSATRRQILNFICIYLSSLLR